MPDKTPTSSDSISSLRSLTTERVTRTSDEALGVLKKDLDGEEEEQSQREHKRRQLKKQLWRPMVDFLRQEARAAEAAKAVVAYTRDLKDFKPDFAENVGVPPGVFPPVQVELTNTGVPPGVLPPVQIVLPNAGPIAIPGLNVKVIPPYDYSGAWVTAAQKHPPKVRTWLYASAARAVLSAFITSMSVRFT
jgi:hypothetical protein